MDKFQSLQQNPLVSYIPKSYNPITIPINLSEKEIQIFEIIKEIIKENSL